MLHDMFGTMFKMSRQFVIVCFGALTGASTPAHVYKPLLEAVQVGLACLGRGWICLSVI